MFIELKNIQKTYSSKSGVTFRALSNVSLSLPSTGLTFLVGASGSGKSTLLNVIGGLDTYDSGDLILAGRNVSDLKNSEVDSLRNTLMGFIFQEFNLIDTLSVFDNVRLALDMQSRRDNDAVHKALEQMGIADKANNKTKDLSGGQRQRVAIARALVKDPQMILADEPTGALDSATSEEVFGILKELSETRLVLVVTHDMDAATKYGDRIIEMKDGRVYRDVRKKEPGEVIEVSEATLYSETLMTVPAGEKVKDSDVKKLNDVIKASARKTYVSVETDPRKVKAMYPYLREVVDAGASASASADGSELDRGAFVPYKPKEEEPKNVEYKKSTLPFGKSAKLSLNNLNHKKARLILTIIISIIAFTLFGVVQSFTMYDMNRAIGETIEEERYTSITLGSALPASDRIADSDLDSLKEKMPNAEYFKKYNMTLPLSIPNQSGMYSFTEFDSVIETDDVSKIGLAMYAGSSKCDDFDSIIVSRYAAEALYKGGAVNAVSCVEVVGSTISSNGRNYKIVGVFDCDVDSMDRSTGMTPSAWTAMYVKMGYVENYSARLSGTGSIYYMSASDGNDNSDYNRQARKISVVYDSDFDYEKVVPITTGRISKATDVILSYRALQNFGIIGNEYDTDIVSAITEFNANANRSLMLKTQEYNGSTVWASSNFTIVGYTDDGYENLNIVLHDSIRDGIFKAGTYAVGIVASFDPISIDAEDFVNAAVDSGFAISEGYVNDYNMALAMIEILRTPLLVVAIVLCLLVVLLLNSFISSSIKITRKQIGILRALGAKKSDTFKIYAIEGFIMTIFSLVVSIIILIVGAPIINLIVGGVYGYYFTLISIPLPVYFIMAGIALAVTVVSVALPIRKFNKISPVSAINGKE